MGQSRKRCVCSSPFAIGQNSVTWPLLTTGRLRNEIQLGAQVDEEAGCGEHLAVSATHPSSHLCPTILGNSARSLCEGPQPLSL